MVWGGATVDAIARLKREQAVIASKRSSIRPHQLGAGSPKESFDCMFLCDVCGYLCDTDPACPSCGRTAWIDLDYWHVAEALREREEEERRHPPDRLKWQVRLASVAAGAAIGIGCAGGLALAGLVALGWPSLLGLGGGATALAHRLGRRRIGRALMLRGSSRPTRWHMPLPLVAAEAVVAARAVGQPQPRGPLLAAPFSGRPCLGYELGVLFDAPGDAWPPIWVLREMRSSAFDIDGRHVEADAVTLGLPLTAVTRPAMTESARQRFLRQRGLFLADGQFELFEAIVEPGAAYEVQWPSAPAGVPPVIHATTGVAPRGAYR
ncbi:hypothetical protein [Nannocystis bainbridge]|uniref:Uncharacterized protein n=1 Tax=Nannocystis bainbridge TaxID=2995303 RepID=A0ABT5E0T2_9BACT|nr:hypothetical protein [Nannocystis bainbridge]MDC0719015.1 hypothetical protein [Nannocystis bainbridge]